MRDEIPAALPLLAFAVALATAPLNCLPRATLGACAAACLGLFLLRCRRAAMVLLCAAAGAAVSIAASSRARAEVRQMASIDGERFVRIEAPIERDWIVRPHVNVLRTSSFRAGGVEFDSPVAFYARFPPPAIEMESTVVVEGFLRRDELGRFSVSVKSPRLLSYAGRLPSHSPKAWNRMIANRLRRHAAARPSEIAMIEALVLGRGERLDEETRDAYKRGGTYHLLVFSGLQISLAAAAIALLLRWAGAPRASDYSLLAFALLAPPFIGASPSVSRASMGIALYAVSRIAGRPTSFENLWCVAAMVRLALAPGDLTDPAFHLTYAGAGALLFIGKPLARTRIRWAAYAVAAELAIAPLTLFHFHQFALGGSLATIVMTPLVFVMLLFGIVFCATEAMFVLDAIALLNLVCGAVNAAAAPASGFFTAPGVAAIVIGYALSVAALAFLRGRWRTAVVIAGLLLPVAHSMHRFHSQRSVSAPEVTFLDVGQGDAILLRSGRQTVLVDGGGRSDDAWFGEAVLIPLLVDRGVRTIDHVVLTHAHPDHCGGLDGVMRNLRVRSLLLSPRRLRGECADRVLGAAAASRTPLQLVRESARLSAGAFQITLLASPRRHRRAPENNGSIVLRAEAEGRAVLLTGDIEAEAESALQGEWRRSDVLKVAHHGSKSSTTPPFLTSVQPRIAVISCGRRNLFGHPHESVVSRLRAGGARIARTDQNGSIVIRLTGSQIRMEREIDTVR